jgi:hypothetical protein
MTGFGFVLCGSDVMLEPQPIRQRGDSRGTQPRFSPHGTIDLLDCQSIENLCRSILNELELALSVDLSDVQVRICDAGSLVRGGRLTLAYVDLETIFISDILDFSAGLVLLQFILAHEVAHILQHRLGTSLEAHEPDDQQIECEASKAALCFVSGLPVGSLSPAFRKRRSFDIQGHYYTVYLCCLMAGAPPAQAARIAFYAQLPDQIWEIDAMGVCEWFCAEANNLDSLRPKARATRLANAYGGSAALSMMDIIDYFKTIQRGVHCLTGGTATSETAYRKERLLHVNPSISPVVFGAAVHAFGDSYAHRSLSNSSVMYSCGVGHGKDVGLVELNLSNIRESTYLGGHAADNISIRRALYMMYAVELWSILRTRFKERKALVPEKLDAADWIEAVFAIPSATRDGDEQISLLTQLIKAAAGQSLGNNAFGGADKAAKMLFDAAKAVGNAGTMSSYQPGGKAIPYCYFLGRADRGEQPFTRADFGWLIDLAEGWKVGKR